MKPEPTQLLAAITAEARKGAALVDEVLHLLEARAHKLSVEELGEIAAGIDALAIRARVLSLEAAFDALVGRPGFAEASAELRALAHRCGEVVIRAQQIQRGEKLARRTSSMPAPVIRPSTIS